MSARKTQPIRLSTQKEIPLYSQFLDVKLEGWSKQACGIVAVKSIMDFLGATTPPLDKLIKIGLEMGAYDLKNGWVHDGLVKIAEHYNLQAATYNCQRQTTSDALKKLKRIAPCITSIYKNFNPENGGHLIVVWEIVEDRVFYSDPIATKRNKIYRRITTSDFSKGWKKCGVIIKK